MRRSIRIPRPTAVILHPEDPALKVHVEKPSRADFMEWRQKAMGYRQTIPAVNPMTGEPIRDADGNLETITTAPNVPVSEMHAYLGTAVKRIEGLEEKNAEVAEALEDFLEDRWDVMVEQEIPDPKHPGKKIKKLLPQSFVVYLLNKVNDDETFKEKTPDPLASASAAQPTSG